MIICLMVFSVLGCFGCFDVFRTVDLMSIAVVVGSDGVKQDSLVRESRFGSPAPQTRLVKQKQSEMRQKLPNRWMDRMDRQMDG